MKYLRSVGAGKVGAAAARTVEQRTPAGTTRHLVDADSPYLVRVEIKPRLKKVVFTFGEFYRTSWRGAPIIRDGRTAYSRPFDGTLEALARGFIGTPTEAGKDQALAGILDHVIEAAGGGHSAIANRLARFLKTADQDEPEKELRQERRDRAYADKRFAVGDTVEWRSGYGGPPRVDTVVAVTWDEPALTWRVAIPGVGAPQSYFKKVAAAEPAADPIPF